MNKKYLLTRLSIFVVATLLFAVSASPVNAAPASMLYFTPASNTISNGANLPLAVMINPGTNAISAVALHITYDQTKLSLDSITPSATFSLVLLAASIDNTNGTASIDLGVPTTSPSATTTSIIATFNFHAIATGTNSPVDFTVASQAAADGEAGNVVFTRTGALVNIVTDPGDITPAVLSAGYPSGALVAGTTQSTVSVTTNEDATCKYSTTSGVSYAAIANTFTSTGSRTHTFSNTGLVGGGSYGYFVRCQDINNNSNPIDYLISFSVASPVGVASSSNDNKSSKKKKKTPPRKISNSKKSIMRGATLTQRGKKFSKNTIVQLYFSKSGGGYYSPQNIRTSSTGSFVLKYKATKPKGQYAWYAVDTKTNKKSKIVYYKIK